MGTKNDTTITEIADFHALPFCGKPASTRIEVYSPRDGRLHGCLDGSLNVCAEHVLPAVEAVVGADLIAHQLTQPIPSATVRCGEGWDFTTTPAVPLKAPDVTRSDPKEKIMSTVGRIDNDPQPTMPIVRVLMDDRGRAIIALDAASADALDSYLCNVDLQALRHDGSLPQDQADAQANVLAAIAGALGKHLRGR